MSDPLKEFIEMNRSGFDGINPSDQVWTKIETAMIASPAIPVKTIKWIKPFTFGASMIVATVAIYTFSHSSNPAPSITVEKNELVIPVTKISLPEKASQALPVQLAAAPEKEIQQNLTPVSEKEIISSNPESPFTEEKVQEPETSPATIQYTSKTEGENLHIDTLFNGITRLEILSNSVELNITAHTGSNITIKGDLILAKKKNKKDDTKYDIRYERVDTVLKVFAELKMASNSCNGEQPISSTLFFHVPEKINLLVQGRCGDASIEGLRGNVFDVRIGSGNLSIKNISTNIVANTTYGDLDATNITGNMKTSMSSGSIRLNLAKGNLDLRTTFGDMEINNVTGNVKLRGSSGTVQLNNVVGDADVTTTYGDILLQNYKGTPILVTSSGTISGKLVELTGNALFTTTYGDIEMEFINQLVDLSFDLKTTYGDIAIDKNGEHFQEKSRLELKKGDFLIKAVSSSGNQRFE
jgi:lia operon protein LiaG